MRPLTALPPMRALIAAGLTLAAASAAMPALMPPQVAASYQVLHPFAGGDGFKSQSALILGRDGSLLGTAYAGGALGQGDGTAYRLAPDGRLPLWHSFDGRQGGEGPAGLVQARDGNAYGVTTRGGLHLQGTVFCLSPNGRLTVLHSF